MKKLMLSFAAVILTALLLVSACKKGKETTLPENNITEETAGRAGEQGDAQAFFTANGPKSQSFLINPRQSQRLRLARGTVVNIPANAFTINGALVTAAQVKVDILELTDRGGMALTGINTMVRERILESNGPLRIEAAANGVAVDKKLAQGAQLRLEVPDRVRNNRPLNLFDGVTINVPGAGGAVQPQFDWNPVQVPGQANDIPPVVTTSGTTYNFSWPTTGWCNPDWFWSYPAGTVFTTMYVNLPVNPGTLAGYQGIGGGNTYVLFVPQGKSTIYHIYTHYNNNNVESYANSIPVGITGRLLAYSVVGTSYYFAKKDIVTTGSATVPINETLNLTPTTQAALTAELTALSTY